MGVVDTEPFETLAQMAERHKPGKHRISAPATSDAIVSLERHLGERLPQGLHAFLSRYNGCELFDGALRIYGTNEITFVQNRSLPVYAFAESRAGESWVFAKNNGPTYVFGLWDGERVEPMHAKFVGWLSAEMEILGSGLTGEVYQDGVRFESDPADVHQLVRAARRALDAGQPQQAVLWLEQAVRVDPGHIGAWQRLGDCLATTDRNTARTAWLSAFHRMSLPLPWPGSPSITPDILSSLFHSYPDQEPWERELDRFLVERVEDVGRVEEFELVVAVVMELANAQTLRGKRADASATLQAFLERASTFTYPSVPWRVLLAKAAIEADLGHFDAAEDLIAGLRTSAPPKLRAAALALLGKVALIRDEPWVGAILDDAEAAGPDHNTRLDIALIRTERALRKHAFNEARAAMDLVHKLVASGASRRYRARALLLQGDVARAFGDEALARKSWSEMRSKLDTYRSPGLLGRLEVRLGDLALQNRQPDEAIARYRRALSTFVKHQLPIREAWVCVRLASVLPEDRQAYLQRAKVCFQDTELASGISLVCQLLGQVDQAVAWHLDYGMTYVRNREAARESADPQAEIRLERAERRLGAHSLAVREDAAVVSHLAQRLHSLIPWVKQAQDTFKNRYVAAYLTVVELLAAHRSFEAAELLREQFVSVEVAGLARSRLVDVLAQSSNVALIDGILQVLEQPSLHQLPVVVDACALMGRRREKLALPALVQLVERANAEAVRVAAIRALGAIGEPSVTDVLAGLLHDPKYASDVVIALLRMGDRQGLETYERALKAQREDLSKDAALILGRYGGPDYLHLLRTVAQDGHDASALSALAGLGWLGESGAVESLLQAMRTGGPALQVASEAMSRITGHVEDAAPAELAERWSRWWDDNAAAFPRQTRFRHGKHYRLDQVLDALAAPDLLTRRLALEEAIIQSGQQLAFDPAANWHTRTAQVAAWRKWWEGAQTGFPSGRWIFFGRTLA